MICTVNAIDTNSEDTQTVLCFEMNADACGQSINKYMGVINASITSGEVEEEAGRWNQLWSILCKQQEEGYKVDMVSSAYAQCGWSEAHECLLDY